MRLDKLIEKQQQKLESLLQKRNDMYEELQHKLKSDLIQMYVDGGGTKQLTLKSTKHEILIELMDLVYNLDPVIRQNEMLMNQKRLLEEEGK